MHGTVLRTHTREQKQHTHKHMLLEGRTMRDGRAMRPIDALGQVNRKDSVQAEGGLRCLYIACTHTCKLVWWNEKQVWWETNICCVQIGGIYIVLHWISPLMSKHKCHMNVTLEHLLNNICRNTNNTIQIRKSPTLTIDDLYLR